MALSCTWMILRLKQPVVGPGPWQSVTQAQECFLCSRAVSQELDACTLAASHPCKGEVTLGIKHHHHLVRSPPGAQRDEKVHVSFHSPVPDVQGTGMGGNQLDPKSLFPLYFKGSHPTDWQEPLPRHSLCQEHQHEAGLTMPAHYTFANASL